MSFAFYMNMEKMSIDIAQKHIDMMTQDNFELGNHHFLDDKKLLNNIENGFVAITQMKCYIESFLNTIINLCIGYNDKILLKCSIEEKIDIIFLYYKKDFKSIKSQHCWECYNKASRVRNEMIHFKKPFVGHGSGIPGFNLGGENVGKFFTQQNMDRILANHIELAKAIATELSLNIFDEVKVFGMDECGTPVNYVYSSMFPNIDASKDDENI